MRSKQVSGDHFVGVLCLRLVIFRCSAERDICRTCQVFASCQMYQSAFGLSRLLEVLYGRGS
jgi:hypothetical protein